jgi:hypothetical protein
MTEGRYIPIYSKPDEGDEWISRYIPLMASRYIPVV